MDDATEKDLADRMVHAGSLVEAGQWLQAVAILKGLLENPALSEHGYREWLTAACHLTLGNALDAGDDLEGAVASYRACIEVALDDPTDPDWDHVEAAYSSMAASWRVRERWAEALYCYQKAYEVDQADYLIEHILAMETQLSALPAKAAPMAHAAPPGFRRLSTSAKGKPFWCQGSIAAGIKLQFDPGSARFDAADWSLLLAHFAGRKDVPMGAHRTAPPSGSLGAYLRAAHGQNLASYLVPVMLEEGRVTVAKHGKSILLDFAGPQAPARYALDVFAGGRLEACGIVEQLSFQDGHLRYVCADGVEVTQFATPTNFAELDTRDERPARVRFLLGDGSLITFCRLADNAQAAQAGAEQFERLPYSHFLSRFTAPSDYRLLSRDGRSVPLRFYQDCLLADTEEPAALAKAQELNLHRAEWQHADTPIAHFLDYRGGQMANMIGPEWAIARVPQDTPDAESAVARALSPWFRDAFAQVIKPDGSYRGWVTDFGYSLDGETAFGLDLRREDHCWALFVLAVGWSYTGPWENSAAFVGVLAELDLLRHERWVAEGVDCVLRRARAHLHRRLESGRGRKFPYPWRPGFGDAGRRRVFFPSHWKAGLVRAVEVWPRVRERLRQATTEDFEGEAFVRAFLEDPELAGLTALPTMPNRRMRVKVPLLLRELRAQGLSRVPATFCVIPDSRVKTMRDTLGLPNGGGDAESFLREMKRIGEAYGNLYDMPLFAFWEYCHANPASQHPKKFVNCRNCPVQKHCATFARRGYDPSVP